MPEPTTVPLSAMALDAAALARACRAPRGHFDELRASADPAVQSLHPHWETFFAHAQGCDATELDRRLASLQRQIRDNGVTYNVYADAEGPQRPWTLDLFPLLLGAQEWRHIEAGIIERMRLNEALLRDAYGEQRLLRQGLVPPALVLGHPGYLRAQRGSTPVAGMYLHVAAFDLVRAPDGLWWLMGQRLQSPSGLGYLLENRLAVGRQFGQSFEALRVQGLAETYRAWMDCLKRLCPEGEPAHLALLTPGPYNETYFEHAYLARMLGLSLVEGKDLLVREQRLYLKTLRGLVRVHGLLKRVDDEYLDPLELRSDSTLGVPGLLQAVRAGQVLVANAPGSAFLESPALLGFLPALAEEVLGHPLRLPALPSWWCGEAAALADVLPQLQRHTIKPSYPGSVLHPDFETVLGPNLSPHELAQWRERLRCQGEACTVQAFVPPAQMPIWPGPDAAPGVSTRMQTRPVLLRVYALCDGVDAKGQPRWRVLPGGLARVAAGAQGLASMQRGGSSADVWVPSDAKSPGPAVHDEPDATLRLRATRMVTSRAGENLYWLGRYTERSENTVRLARLVLEYLSGEYQALPPLQDWLSRLALANTLVLPGVPTAVQSPRAFMQALIADLSSRSGATSVGFNLRALRMAAASVRERLSQEHWSAIVLAEDELSQQCDELRRRQDLSTSSALRTLKSTSDHLSSITGAQTDRMARDDGWRLLSIGRHVERLAFFARALDMGLDGDLLRTDGGFEAMLALFDSTIHFRASYQQSRSLWALTSLLVHDRDHPRALAWVAHTLRGRLARLAGSAAGVLSELSLALPDPQEWAPSTQLERLPPDIAANTRMDVAALRELLRTLVKSAHHLSDQISATYFTHAHEADHSLAG